MKALEEDFLKSMKDFRKEASPRKLLRNIETMSNAGEFTPNMTFIALRTLQRMNRIDLSVNLLPYWKKSVETHGEHNVVDVTTAVGVLRVFCRLQDMETAIQIANSVGVAVEDNANISATQANKHLAQLQQGILPELALGYISKGNSNRALNALFQMQDLDLTVDTEVSTRILKQFLTLAKPDAILQVLQVLIAMGGLQDNDSVQLITNYYFRNIEFITGAVSIPTLPEASVPEVCFIGRSNVGKSSLINMICNRKGVAFTSKRPGKTAEFNYFAINGVVGVAKQAHKFHMVDLPGVGFAKQRKELRTSWTKLLADFVAQRSTLRVVYHLVDSRHGLLEADEECLSLLENLPARTQYVIVLTKVDKQRNKESFSKALDGIIDKIYAEVAKKTSAVVPIILTSAETKHGAANMLLNILEAVAPLPVVDAEESAASVDNVTENQ